MTIPNLQYQHGYSHIDVATKFIEKTENIFETKLCINFQDKETVFE